MKRKPNTLTAMEKYALGAVYGSNWPQMNNAALKSALDTIKPQMLPGMGKPEFGGVQLRPGMESRRAYTGPQWGLFDQPATATQDTMLGDVEILTQL